MNRVARRNALMRTALPIVGGACIAAVSAALLSGPSILLVAFPFCAGFVLIPSLVVKDRLVYWLCLFLLILPFDISKGLMPGDRAMDLVTQFGGAWGAVSPSIHLIDLALVPLLGVWLTRKIRNRERIWFPRISYVPLACLCFVTVTGMVAPSPYFASLVLVKQWRYFLIYVFVVDALDLRKVGKTILTILIFTLVLQAAFTLVRYRLQYFQPFFGDALGRMSEGAVNEATRSVTGVADTDTRLRGFGTFYHPNATAMHLELLLPFALILALSGRSWRSQAIYASVFGLGVMGFYVTFSRNGMSAFLASMLACALVAAWRGLIPRRALAPLAGVALFGGLCLTPVLVSYMNTRPEATRHHMEHLRQAAVIALHNPIFGVGLNNSGLVRPHLAPGGITDEESQLPLHSGLLLGLAETGVIGFTLYLGFFVLIGIDALRQSRSHDFLTRTFSVGILGAYTAMGVHMMTDYMGIEAFYVMIWLYAGLIVSQRRRLGALSTAAAAPARPTYAVGVPLGTGA